MSWKDILKYNPDEYWDRGEAQEMINEDNKMEIMEAAFGDRNSIKDSKELRDKEPEMKKKLIKYLREHHPLSFEDSEELARHDGFHPDLGFEVSTRNEEGWIKVFFENGATGGDFFPEEKNGELWGYGPEGWEKFENWEDWERNHYGNSSYWSWWKDIFSW
tara:strand:- start:45 stop:527 length:483 start_codon:yes stop_codon:yes gene_type:complete